MIPGLSRGKKARDLMEPLRVCLGWSETVRAGAEKLAEQGASAAPVIRRGHAAGLVTRDQLEGGLRLGLGDQQVGKLVGGPAPRAAATAGLRSLIRRARGTTPGLIVGSLRGPILGIVKRSRLQEEAARSPRAVPTSNSLLSRMSRALPEEHLRILEKAGKLAGSRGVRLHLVGGVVRDLLLGSAALDLDLVVETDGPGFARSLAAALGGRAAVHTSFGTAVVTAPDGVRLDVATMRRETYGQAAALPRVKKGTFLEDLLRRDVTINAMAIRLDGAHRGRLVDELGGRNDLHTGVLRVHHMASICEDPTRAFRIARFAARFGFRPSPETRGSIRLAAETGAFRDLTGERLLAELTLVVEEPDPAAAIASMARLDLLRHLGAPLPFDRAARRRLVRLIAGLSNGPISGLEGTPEAILLILMTLVRGVPSSSARAIADRLRIRGEKRGRLIEIRSAVSRLLSSLRRATSQVAIVRSCDRHRPEVLAVAWAEADPAAGRSLDNYLRRLRWMRPFLTGEDLRAMGLRPGPAYRVILGRLREAKLAGRIRGRRDEKALAERLVKRIGRKDH